MVRYPRLIADKGRRASQMILNIDLAPTILDLAGLNVPALMQGQSAKPILQSPNTPGRKSWLYEHFPVFPIPIPGICAVRTEKYKYIEYQNDVRPTELFNLESDPGEKNNIISTDRETGTAQRLKVELERLKKETGYRFFTHG